jgi:hypothetical protein
MSTLIVKLRAALRQASPPGGQIQGKLASEPINHDTQSWDEMFNGGSGGAATP